MSILKLGAAVFVGYTYGGKLGVAVFNRFGTPVPSSDSVGAMWAGRVVVFLGSMYALNKIT